MALRSTFKISDFYKEDFKNLTLSKTLWKTIFIKLFIILIILKLFIFDVNLKNPYRDDASKSNFVIQNLISKENQ